MLHIVHYKDIKHKTRTCESRNKISELCENIVTAKLKFVYWQFVWPPRPIYIMASTYLPIRAVSLLADILHRNNSPDLMRRWNAFNCGEVCIDHRIDQHIVDQIENSLKIWSTLIDLGEHCRVTIFLCFSCCSSKKKYSSHPHISSYSYPGSSFPVGVEFWAISRRPNDGLYIAAPLLSAH